MSRWLRHQKRLEVSGSKLARFCDLKWSVVNMDKYGLGGNETSRFSMFSTSTVAESSPACGRKRASSGLRGSEALCQSHFFRGPVITRDYCGGYRGRTRPGYRKGIHGSVTSGLGVNPQRFGPDGILVVQTRRTGTPLSEYPTVSSCSHRTRMLPSLRPCVSLAQQILAHFGGLARVGLCLL